MHIRYVGVKNHVACELLGVVPMNTTCLTPDTTRVQLLTLMTDSTEAENIQQKPLVALILASRDVSKLRVGSIGILERWRREFKAYGAEPRVVNRTELEQALAEADERVLLAIGAWVMESLGHEAIIENASACESDEVLVLTAPGLDASPAICLGQAAARKAAGLDLGGGIPGLLSAIGKDDSVRIRRIEMQASYWAEITDEKSAEEATWGLLKRLQYRPGGIVAKYLNRPISIRMSRLLVNTRVTADQTTWFAFFVGALGIAAVFIGGYWWTLLGGALLQINSILDGVDGELARLRVKTSEFGAYLDSVCDEILNAALFVAIGYNLYKHGGWVGADWVLYPFIGAFVGGMAFIYSLVHWHCKWKHGLGFYWWFDAYKPRKQVQRSTSVFTYFKKLFWKESYLMIFFLCTIFHIYEVLLWCSLPVAINTIVFFFIHIVIKRARW